MSDTPSAILQQHLDRLQAGDPSARDELLAHAYARLQGLAMRMLSQFPGVRRWADVDDVSNSAALRLWKTLADVKPATVRAFYGLAALQIRRELLDLARHYTGPCGIGANHESVAPGVDGARRDPNPSDGTHDPGRLAQWTEFHRQVDRLPDEEREVFDLLFYQELSQAEAAEVLGVSEPTLRRRWLAARLHLQETLQGGLPG